jgi:hypothetical protein
VKQEGEREEVPPWEQPGAVRRDCEPHRGDLLRVVGILSLWLGWLSFCFFPLSWLVVPVGLATWAVAPRDLLEMRAGRMDPQGEVETAEGKSKALIAVYWSLILAAPGNLLLLFALYEWLSKMGHP